MSINQKAIFHPEQTAPPLVEVVILGKVRPMAAKVAAAHVQAIFDLPCKVLPALPDPEYAFLPNRGQYDASPILMELAQDGSKPPLRLGVMAKDLCLPFLTHVFGEAQLAGRSAVISLYRLWGPGMGDNNEILLQRTAKVALHEVAHIMGLVHCRNRHCLMNFSPSLEHLDQLEMILCPKCSQQLHRERLRLLRETAMAQAACSQG